MPKDHHTLYLFVPAIRLDRVPKAVATGADVVIIDLEDAVADDQKDDVREQLIKFDATSNDRYWLRVNASHQSEHTLMICSAYQSSIKSMASSYPSVKTPSRSNICTKPQDCL